MNSEAILDHVRKLTLAQRLLDQANTSLAELHQIEGLPSYLSRMSMGLEDVVDLLKKVAERHDDLYQDAVAPVLAGEARDRVLHAVHA